MRCSVIANEASSVKYKITAQKHYAQTLADRESERRGKKKRRKTIMQFLGLYFYFLSFFADSLVLFGICTHSRRGIYAALE